MHGPVRFAGCVLLCAFGLVSTALLFAPTAAGSAQALENLRHLTDILTRAPRNIGNIWIPLAVLASAWWPGHRLLRFARVNATDTAAQVGFSISMGLAAWIALCTLLGISGLLYAPVLWTIAGALLALGVFDAARVRYTKPRLRFDVPTAIVIVCALAVAWIALLGALEPEVQFDGRHYHLADALRYAQHHRAYDIAHAEHFMYGGYANYFEVFIAAIVTMGGVGAAKVMAWSFGIVGFAAVYAMTIEVFGNRLAAMLGALAFLATPIVTWAMTTESTDLALVPFVMTVLWLVYRWSFDRRSSRALMLAGALCGVILGLKAFGLEFTLCVVCLVASIARERRFSTVAVFLGSTLVFASGWFAQSYAYTGDPLFPIGASIFHTPFSYPSTLKGVQDTYTLYGANAQFGGIIGSPIWFTYAIDRYRDIIGSVFLFGLPLICWRLLRDRFADRVYAAGVGIAFAGLVLLYLFGTVEIRFLTWGLAIAASLIAVAAADLLAEAKTRAVGICAVTIVCIAVAASNQITLPLERYAALPQVMGPEYLNWAYLYGDAPEESVQLQYVPMIGYMNDHLTPGDKVFDGARLMFFNSYSNIELYNGSDFASPASQGEWSLSSSDAYDRLRANAVDYVVVFTRDRDDLRASTLWHHLKYVTTAPSGPIDSTGNSSTLLYKIVALSETSNATV